MTKNTKSTRYFSSQQEKQVAKTFGGYTTSNSGANRFSGGDVTIDKVVIECKTTMTPKTQFTIKQEWLDKLREEMFSTNKDYCALTFNFGPGTRDYYVIDEGTFELLMEKIREM